MKCSVMVHACNPSHQLAEAERPEIQGHLGYLMNSSQAEIRETHFYFTQPNQNKKEHSGSIRHKQGES